MMADMTPVDMMVIELREGDIPFFVDPETNDNKLLEYYLNKNGGDFNAAMYECCLLKAESTGLSVSGANSSDSAPYFRRLARKYKPSNSGVLKGGY